jgi:hypothetical protein
MWSSVITLRPIILDATSIDNTSISGDYCVIALKFTLFLGGVDAKAMRYDVALRRSIAPTAESSQDYNMKNHANNDGAVHLSDAQGRRT